MFSLLLTLRLTHFLLTIPTYPSQIVPISSPSAWIPFARCTRHSTFQLYLVRLLSATPRFRQSHGPRINDGDYMLKVVGRQSRDRWNTKDEYSPILSPFILHVSDDVLYTPKEWSFPSHLLSYCSGAKSRVQNDGIKPLINYPKGIPTSRISRKTKKERLLVKRKARVSCERRRAGVPLRSESKPVG